MSNGKIEYIQVDLNRVPSDDVQYLINFGYVIKGSNTSKWIPVIYRTFADTNASPVYEFYPDGGNGYISINIHAVTYNYGRLINEMIDKL